MLTYTLADVASLLGLSRTVISGLIDSGFVSPERGPRREYRFSFQDMVLLRAAQGLQGARIPPRRIVNSLRRLRATLPEQMPPAGLRIAVVGNEVVVRDGGGAWQAGSGQLLFDFEAETAAGAPHGSSAGSGASGSSDASASPAPPASAKVSRLVPRPRVPATAIADSPAEIDWFQRGIELEVIDRAQAEAAYRRAIEQAPQRPDAYLNLGVLLGESGRHEEAASVYRRGIDRCTPEALLHFNLAVALEEMALPEAAIRAYEQCLAIDATMADAHFNAAQLHDQLGRAKGAIRHYSAYRRLRRRDGGA